MRLQTIFTNLAIAVVMTNANGLLGVGTAGQSLTGSGVTPTSQSGVRDFDVESRRPLNDAFSVIEDRLHIPINYEEMVIVDRSQLIAGEDVGLSKGRLYPKGGRLTVHYVPGETNALSAVQTTLVAHEQAHLAGSYVAIQDGHAITVYPSSYASLFQTRISFPASERTIGETIELIARQVANTSSKQITVLNQPYTGTEKITLGAQSELVSNVLEQFNVAVGPTSFRFIYDPPEKTYYLNVNSVLLFSPEESIEPVSPQPQGQHQQHQLVSPRGNNLFTF